MIFRPKYAISARPNGTVAVRTAWRRQGIARTLLIRCLAALAEQDLTIARLYVDAQSVGAQQLYDSIGFRVTKEHRRYQKPFVSPGQGTTTL